MGLTTMKSATFNKRLGRAERRSAVARSADAGVASDSFAKAQRDLARALRLLEGPGGYNSDEWLLLATLVGEADLVLHEANKPATLTALLDQVVEEFRSATSNFTDVEFLKSTKPARRRNPRLFNGL